MNKLIVEYYYKMVMRYGAIVALVSVSLAVRGQCPEITGDRLYAREQVFRLENLSYGKHVNHPSQMLDLYVPLPSLKCDRANLILLIHGGGFEGGNKNQLISWGYYFAQRGYHVAAINYRLYMNSQQEIDDFLLNPFVFFGDGECARLDEVSVVDGMFKIDKAWYFAIQDGHAALAYLQSLFEQHGKRLEYVYAMGQSAGAISALGLALGQQNEFNQLNPLLEGFYGGLKDRVLYKHANPKGIDGVVSISGGLLNAHHFLSVQDSLPVLFLHGAQDEVVPLCEDECHYNERRLSGPLRLTEMAASLGLKMPMALHIWADKSHDLSTVYPDVSKIALDWLVSNSTNLKVVDMPVYVHPENALLRTCASAYAYLDLLDFKRQLSGGDDHSVPKGSVFPNPSLGQFTLYIPGFDAELVDIALYDMFGRLAFVEHDQFVLWNETKVNAQSLPAGVYHLVVRYNEHIVQSHKVVID